MGKLLAVISETFYNQVKSKSFLALLLIPVALVIVSIGAGYLSSNNTNNNDNKIAIIADDNIRKEVLKTDNDLFDSSIKTNKQAQYNMRNDSIYGYVNIKKHNNILNVEYTGNNDLEPYLKQTILEKTSSIQNEINIKSSNLTKYQIHKLSVEPNFHSKLYKHNNNDDSLSKTISLQILICILYFFLIMYASTTASIIAKDKGSKVLEIILSSTSSTTYFLGKIIGIVFVMLLQIGIYALIIVSSYGIFRRLSFVDKFIDDNRSLIENVVNNIFNINSIFIIMGLIMCIVISALCGALVSRKEDANKAAQPIIFLILIVFLLALLLQNNSGGSISVFMSYFPLSSFFFMPMRIINDQANIINIVMSLAILIISIIILIFGIIRIYKSLMLQDNDRSFFKKLIESISQN